MPVDTTRCPRCKAPCVAHITEDQWRCSQCGHQWDFAKPEERALVPDHLRSEAREEEYLERFLAIKNLTKLKGEKIWNCCTTAFMAISCAVDEHKPRLLRQHFDNWLDQLDLLQRTLIIDRLLPLAREYQIVPNERAWLFNVCENVWTPVESGYQGWLVYALLGSLRFPNDRSVPRWAWFLTGHPNGLPGADQGKDTIHAFLSGFEYTVRTYLLRRRQEAIDEVTTVRLKVEQNQLIADID